MQLSLSGVTGDCAQLLDTLASLHHDPNCKERSALGYESVEDQSGRFRIWAGALQHLRVTSPLDRRLRESHQAEVQAQKLLQDLQDALQNLYDIASGKRPNRMYDTDGDNDADFDVTDVPHHEATAGIHTNEQEDDRTYLLESQELFESVKETIASLFRISIVIRNNGSGNRFARALSAYQTPFNHSVDINYVGHKYPPLNTEAKKWLRERLGKAITFRRQCLRYAREQRNSPDDEFGRIGPSAFPLDLTSISSSTQTQKKDVQDNDSEASHTLSLGDDDVSNSSVPTLSDVAKGAWPFECPLCCNLQNITQESSWRKHFFSDSQPYVCTFEACDAELFSNRNVWFDHEMQNHRAYWYCGFCKRDRFQSSQNFEEHIRHFHVRHLTNDQLEALCKISRRTIDQIPASDCPFCDDWEIQLREAKPGIPDDEVILITPAQYEHHVGSHMEQLALFAIPEHHLESNSDSPSAAQVGIVRVVEGNSMNSSSSFSVPRPVDDTRPKNSIEDQNMDGVESGLGSQAKQEGVKKRIAIAGTCGLALQMAREIQASTGHSCVVLSRKAQPDLMSLGYECQIVDYGDPTSIQHSVMGVDTIISTISGQSQLRLIEAAVICQVRRFIPAEFEGQPGLRTQHLLDRGRGAALALLQHYRGYIESTVIVCGILYERFSIHGMKSHGIGVNTGYGNEGDYIVDVRNRTALAPVYDSAQSLSHLCMTSACDVAQFVVMSLDMDSWPQEMSICGDRLSVNDLIEAIAAWRGRPFHNVEWQNPAGLEYQMTMAQLAGDMHRQRCLASLIETSQGSYDFAIPVYLNTAFPEIEPETFESWFIKNWA